MNLQSFVDELTKLGAADEFRLGDVLLGTRAPLNSIGVLVRRALQKRASGLGAFHEELAPSAPEVSPGDASTRLPDASAAPSQIRPGALGGVTPSADPIDRERFNRVWNSPIR
jgi:hypothetical protein